MTALQTQSLNYWPQSACARAFWGQHEAPSYRRLLDDTKAWLQPMAGQKWLDLGCGCGKLTQALWEKGQGRLGQIIGMDCAADNEKVFRKLRETVQPQASESQIQFQHGDFSNGLAKWSNESFDGVVSGLAIQYAESFSEERNCWTTEAYDHLLREIHRLLKKGGLFVFSVNVPEPGWARVALASLTGIFQTSRPGRFLKKSIRMLRYGTWLKQEARRGRFHFLPIETIEKKLREAGFISFEYRLSYAKQAYVIRCEKPA